MNRHTNNSLSIVNGGKINIPPLPPAPPSTLPIRLNAADTNTPYIGRLQVFHNGEWGSVCNDIFGMEEANLACNGLNYTEGAVCYATSTLFPPSRGNANESCLHVAMHGFNCVIL